MRWKKLHRRDLPQALAMLRAEEWRAVPLTARLCREGRPALPLPLEAAVYACRAPQPCAVLLLTQAGLALPVFAPGAEPGKVGLPRELAVRLYSVMGPSREVQWVERLVAESPAASIDYHLMVIERDQYRPPERLPGPPGLVVRRAGPEDLPALLPLQVRYEIEEVVVRPDRFSELACRQNLKSLLRRQRVLMAELDGRAVAKAGTNARGFDVDQIGGVFTDESQRRQGVGCHLMHALLEELLAEKKAVSLFVKCGNQPALALYRRLGFRIAEGYRISYYRL